MADKLLISKFVVPIDDALSRETILIPDGAYSLDDILAFLVDRWIPILHCRECSRFTYCKFSQRDSTRFPIDWGQQCGVVVSALDNVLRVYWERLLISSGEQLSDFFSALFHFVNFLWKIELTVGDLSNSEGAKVRGESTVRWNVEYLMHLRYELDSLSFGFRDFVSAGSISIWLLVEGQSEQTFLQRLIDRRFFPSSIYGVNYYGGKSNATSTRLKQLTANLTKRGYRILLQGDADRSKKKPFQDIIKAQVISEDDLFTFSRDFESSFPAPLLKSAFEKLGHDLNLDWLDSIVANPDARVIPCVKQKIGQNIDKEALAFQLGNLTPGYYLRYSKKWEAEIFKWLEFIRSRAYPRIDRFPQSSKQ